MEEQLSEGEQLEQRYRAANFSEDEINQWKLKRIDEYHKANFTDEEINKYFGVKQTNTAGMNAYVQKNLNSFNESRKAADGTPQKEAASFFESLDAGWENSVTGLAKAGHLPDTVLPEHAPFFHRLASNIGQIGGDLPAMWAGATAGATTGAVVGGFAGSAVPGVGTLAGLGAGGIIGAGAGAFAAPAAMRRLLIDHYEAKDVRSAGEFMSSLGGVTMDALKAGGVGALTSGAGLVAKPGIQALGAELAAMTMAGAAMEGRLPEPQEFIDGAALLGGFHLATGGVPTKLRNIFAKTGERPGDIVSAANEDVVLKQKLLSENLELPAQAAPEVHETDLDRALAGKGEEPPKKPPQESGGGEPPSGDHEADVNKVLGILAENKIKDSPSIFSKEWWSQKGNDFYRAAVDRMNPLKQAEDESGGSFNGKDSVYNRASSYQGWKGIAESFISRPRNWRGQVVEGGGTIDHKTGKINGESLEEALSSVPKERQGDFTAFALSKRIVERTDAGFKVAKPAEVEAARRNIERMQGEFGQSFDRVVSWNDRVMQYARDAGLISEESHNNIMKGSKDFIPLLVEQDFDQWTGKKTGQDGKLYEAMDEGSTGKKLHPFEQMIRNGMRVVKAAELNQVKMAYGDMVDTAPNGAALGEKIEKPTGASNELSFKRDGELQHYKIPIDKAEAIKSLNADPGKSQLWARMLMAPANWLRTGTVLNPDFTIRHGERSLFVSAVQSKSLGGVFSAPLDVAKAMWQNVSAIGDILQNSDAYQAALRSRGLQSQVFGVEHYLNTDHIWNFEKPEGTAFDKMGEYFKGAWNSALSPLEYMAHVSDNLARVAEFKRAGGVGADINKQFDAGFSARNVTLDYTRAGANVRAVSSFVPFMNIGIQGIDRMVRGWKADPLGFTARASAALTVPTLLNWAANRNDSRYQDAPDWEKDLYWIVPTNKWEKAANIADAMSRPEDLRRQASDGTWEVNNGTTLRISKPFELGLIFATVPERVLNHLAGLDSKTAGALSEQILSTVMHGALPNVLPTALTPVLEQGTNRNFFTSRPVVSSHAEGMLPEYQYNEYTSEVAKQLGKVISYVPGLRDIGPKDAKLASPQVIDNYIHDWTGTLGQYALQIIGKTEQGLGIVNKPPPPTSTMGDWPVIKAFISRNPSQNLQPIQDFYSAYESTSRVVNTIKELQKKGDPQALDLLQKHMAEMSSSSQLGSMKTALGTQAKVLQFINDDPKMSPSDKRQLMDAAYYLMSMIAKRGNQIIDANRKALNAQH